VKDSEMNIGTQTNSLVNHLYSRMTVDAPKPEVGMAATTLSWTDRHAATVVAVAELNSKVWSHEVRVVDDQVLVIKGSTHDGSATYAFAPGIYNHADTYRMNRKTGAWVRGYINEDTGRFQKLPGGLILGRRDHYVDPSF
jgi:hypothetical protein